MSLTDRLLNRAPAVPPATKQTPPPAPAAFPDVLDDEIRQAPTFPFEVFPPVIQRTIKSAHEFLSYNEDFLACGMLLAAAMAVGRTHRAYHTWMESANVYMALVAPPGTGKTHPLLFALAPIIEKNKRAINDYNAARASLELSGEVTGTLVDKQCLFSDFTIEALTKAMRSNKRGIGVYNDELAGFFRNFNRYNSGSEEQFWLQNWSGSPVAVSRMSYKYFFEFPSISLGGTIQPSVLDEIGKGSRGGNGFVERILFCYPDEVKTIPIKRRNNRSDSRERIASAYNKVIEWLLEKELSITGHEGEDDVPHLVSFTGDADDMMTDFINELKIKSEEVENEYKKNLYSKMQNYALRFALLLNRLRTACDIVHGDNPDFPPDDLHEINTADVAHSMVLCEYFLAHALKAHNAISGATPVDKQPRDVQQWYRAIPRGIENSTAEIDKITQKHRISRATMFRLLNESDPQKRMFIRVRHGYYERMY